MSDKENNSENNNATSNEANSSTINNRRSFLIKGAIAAPLIATTAIRPVWAADDSCINSGTLSGNLSNHGCQAIGRSPGWWWNNNGSAQWINTVYSQNDTFYSTFGYKPLSSNKLGFSKDTTLFELGPGSGSKAADMHVVAAILNFSHPGIMYTGKTGTVYSSATDVINAYRYARSQEKSLKKSLLDDLKNELDSYDDTDGHDIHF